LRAARQPGAPRDFEPAIGQLEDVFLYDIDSLQTVCDRNRRARQREVQVAEKIILDETDRFMAEFYNRASSAIVTRLREDWHSISQQELEALYRKLPHLNADDRDAVARTVGRIVNKLLHPPLEALRDEARSGTPHGLVDALKRLFGLQERP
jgi:glutamyl-tRNA reductase